MKKKLSKKDKEIDRLIMLNQQQGFKIIYLFGKMRDARDMLANAMKELKKG